MANETPGDRRSEELTTRDSGGIMLQEFQLITYFGVFEYGNND